MAHAADDGGALYLAIDQGGHASRVVVFDATGTQLLCVHEEVDTRCLGAHEVEQDPEQLVESITRALARAHDALGPRAEDVRAAGLATQRSSIVCWDRHSDATLSPVLSWQDRRAHAWLASLREHAAWIHQRTGLLMTAHYGASKLRWCLDHLPEVARARRENRLACGPLASFLLFRLLNEHPLTVDPANASRTLLMNRTTLDWDPELLALFGIPQEILPRCVPTVTAFGHLDFGGRDLPLTAATGDQSAALYAHGDPGADVAYVNIGTGAFVQRALGRSPLHPGRLLTSIALHTPSAVTYVLEGTVNGAGSALEWIESQLGVDRAHAEREIDAWLLQEPEPPLFLNGIGGLGAPFWCADFESRFIGAGSDRQRIVAVIESIVFLLRANLDAMRTLAPAPAQIDATGGLAEVNGLCQRLADLTGTVVLRPAALEATARGTAYLAAGAPRTWSREKPGARFRPQANAPLHARYARWRAAMDEALRGCSVTPD